MKLGCLPSDPADLKNRLWMANYVDPDAITPAPPASIDRGKLPGDWGELGNDVLNDCPVAAAGHAFQVARQWGQKASDPVPLSDLTTEVVNAYHDMTKGSANPDPGVKTQVALKYWQHTGIAGEKCTNYAAIRRLEDQDWRAAIYLFGFAYASLALPKTVCGAVDHGIYDAWKGLTEVEKQTDDNGHCVIAVGYDNDGLQVVSWGRVINMGWDFTHRYTTEAYAVLLSSWATGQQPGGFNMAQLTADLDDIRAGHTAPPPPPSKSGKQP